MSMLNHWQLREQPFQAVWDARFFYESDHVGYPNVETVVRDLAQHQEMNFIR